MDKETKNIIKLILRMLARLWDEIHFRPHMPTKKTPRFLPGDVLLAHQDTTGMEHPRAGQLIQLFTRSKYNHVGVMRDKDTVVEAVMPRVKETPVGDFIKRYLYCVQMRPRNITDEMRAKGEEFLKELLLDAPPYDVNQFLAISADRLLSVISFASKYIRLHPLLKLIWPDADKKALEKLFKPKHDHFVCSEVVYIYMQNIGIELETRGFFRRKKKLNRNWIVPEHINRSPQLYHKGIIWRSVYHPDK